MSDERRMAKVFVELADTLVADFEGADFLQMLTERCVELLRVDAAALLMADQRGALQLAAYTTEQARLLELFALQAEDGPCVEAFHSGQQLANVDLGEARERWPVFARGAAEVGFGRTHAMPMRLRSERIGALNLFTYEDVALSDVDVAIGQAMADIATIGLLQERGVRAHSVLSEQLQAALNTRVLIEQAKGYLAANAGLSVAEAFAEMRQHARGNQLTLRSVASGVLNGTVTRRTLQTRVRPGPSPS